MEEYKFPDCILCCKPNEVFAMGVCNHKDICFKCTLK